MSDTSLMPMTDQPASRPVLRKGITEVSGSEGAVRLDVTAAVAAGIRENLTLGEPIVASAISGRPGYLFRTREVEFGLAADELYRLLRHALSPLQVLALAKKFGIFHEISDTHYATDTGKARRPLYSAREQDDRLANPEATHLLVVRVDGALRAHSILRRGQAEYAVRDFAASGVTAQALSLHKTGNGVPLQPVDNLVAVYASPEGALQAAGPFRTPECAVAYRDERLSPAMEVSLSTVVSSII